MIFSNDQEQAAIAINAFIKDGGDEPYLTIHGLAGTGKSTLLSAVVREQDVLCAYTGKAASVLRKKTGRDVSTIHSVIYDFKGMLKDEEDENNHKRHPVFIKKHDEDELSGEFVFIDEASMLGERIAKDLLNTGAKLIVTGDPGQLPPVMDSQFFIHPHVTLTEIHRQALESPIIRQAHSVRNSGGYVSDGDGFVVTREMHDELLEQHDIVLCWRNTTRIWLNKRRRTMLGFGPVLRAGEPVMCLKNDHGLKIYNGMIFTLVYDREPGTDMVIQDDLGQRIAITNPTVEMIDEDFDQNRYDDDFSPFAIAYACTTHKAQGSEWQRVLIIDEHRQAEGRRSWLYTSVTRAIERVTIVRRW
jgi:exodeoxyribonuclease-5